MGVENKVISLGALVIDLISYGSRFPDPGETLVGDKFEMGFGGKAGNGCVAAARLGASMMMIGKVGNDSFGKDYLNSLQNEDVDISHVQISDNKATSTANIFVTKKGENCIMFVPGATDELSIADIDNAELTVKNASLFFCTFECNLDVIFHALKVAKKHSVKTVVNAAPYVEGIDLEFYKLSDVFCVNETEAELLSKVPVKSVEDAEKAIDVFLSYGCQIVIITLGKHGAVYGSSSTKKHIPTEEVEAVDTTGAGDAFMGALIYFMSQRSELTIEDMIRKSCSIASISVQRPGTQKSYSKRSEIPNFV